MSATTVGSIKVDRGSSRASLAAAVGILDDAWVEQQRSCYTQLQLGVRVEQLPDLSLDGARRRSEVGRDLLGRIAAVDAGVLPHEVGLALRLVGFRAGAWARDEEWYWTAVDPRGIGAYGLFLPTTFTGGYLLNFVHNQLAAFRFRDTADLEVYLSLATGYAGLVRQFAERTLGQAERGIVIPRVQVVQARAMVRAFATRCTEAVGVRPDRLTGCTNSTGFVRELDRRVRSAILPAFEQLLAVLSDDYLARAPEAVGMGQYRDGDQCYGELVRFHTTLDLTPLEVHHRGLERMDQIQAEMSAIRRGAEFRHGHRAFVSFLDGQQRWRAGSAAEVEAILRGYLDRIEPVLGDAFGAGPRAPGRIAPLPEELQGSMTYGYYDTPRTDRPQGTYLYNATNLMRRSWFYVGALIYHELMPGHHLHFGTQLQNTSLHPFARHSFVNAYNEGWAEYAASLAGELGMYQTPEERYGRLVMDAFLTSRLVVDTGMNALGWSLQRARDYMREYSGMTDHEIDTETIRYSCDRPAQALAYKLGDTEIHRLREHMRHTLGDKFELKNFHAAVLAPGALTLPDLAWHIGHEIERTAMGVS